MLVIKSTLVLLSAFATSISVAQIVAPDVLLKAVTLEVIAIISQDEDFQSGKSANVAELVEARILPLLAFTHMTQIAMARNWRLATPGQQKALAAEFKILLVRTYFTALTSYRNQAIEFKRIHTAYGDTEVTVRSVIRQPGKAPLSIDYDMEKMAEGWKIFDIKIEGVSLITAYRETFAGKVREVGVDGLIKSLADKNQAGGVRLQSRTTEDFYFPILVRSVFQRSR